MMIRCKILRVKGKKIGSEVLIGQTNYFFKPIDAGDPHSPHVALVENEEHIACFLSSPEAYSYYSGDMPDAVRDSPDTTVATGPELPATTDGPTDGYIAMQRVLDAPASATEADADKAYEYLNGRKPHGRAKIETVVARVIEAAVENNHIDREEALLLIAELPEE